MSNFQQIMRILATQDWDDGGPVFSDADLHDIEKHARAMQAEIEQLRAARPQPVPEWVRADLCWFDPRNPNYQPTDSEDGDGLQQPRQRGCDCDPCCFGRDRLAVLILDGVPARPQPDAALQVLTEITAELRHLYAVPLTPEGTAAKLASLIRKGEALTDGQARPQPNAGLVEALRKLLGYAERNECVHEETHREGVIWTVCDGCGKRGADDMGGFKPYQEPTEIAGARDALARAEAGWKEADSNV